MMFYHANHKKRMLIHNLQTQFYLIVGKSHVSFIREILKEYFHVYTIRQSTANILNSGSLYYVFSYVEAV